MFLNYKFIHIETFLYQYLPSTVKHLLDENMLHGDEDKESKKFSIEYFKEFTAGKMDFDAYQINPDFSPKNPLMVLEESKKSTLEFNYKNVISYNNIKVKDLITPRVVDVLLGGKGELVDKDDSNKTIQINHALMFCKPYIYKGVNGALILLDLEATQNEGLVKLEFPFATFFLSDTPKGLDIKSLSFEKGELRETDYANSPFFYPLFTYFFATIAILKMNSMVDLHHTKYTLEMMEDKQTELYKLIEENEGEGVGGFLEGLSQKLLTQLMNDPNITDDRKELIKDFSENFEKFMDSLDEDDENSAFENSQKYGDLQCHYLSELMTCLKIPAYKERVELLHSTEMYERKLLASKLFLPKWDDKSTLNTILDNDNYFTYTDLFAMIENFRSIETYDWLSIAKNLNVGFSDLGEETVLFSSNILQEMEYDESFTMLHSFIKPCKYQNIKGVLFNIAFFKVIDINEISEDDHDEIREMNTLYFFGIEKGEYKLWAVDHNLNTYSELKGSGVDSNLNDKISAQLCAIILYLNAVSFDQVEEYYCRGQADCISS